MFNLGERHCVGSSPASAPKVCRSKLGFISADSSSGVLLQRKRNAVEGDGG